MSGTSETVDAAPAAAGAGWREPVITVRGLVKRYGRREAVRGVDLEVYRGEILSFLGPNGAGKTTTVEILEGFRARRRLYQEGQGVGEPAPRTHRHRRQTPDRPQRIGRGRRADRISRGTNGPDRG
jgi:ABC-type glutathione transport system ATPase component